MALQPERDAKLDRIHVLPEHCLERSSQVAWRTQHLFSGAQRGAFAPLKSKCARSLQYIQILSKNRLWKPLRSASLVVGSSRFSHNTVAWLQA